LLLLPATALFSQWQGSTISVLAIGNADYKHQELFLSDADINFSATAFLNCFKGFSTPCIMQSGANKFLSKEKMLTAIRSFVDFVEHQQGSQNIGIIYYCGHGLANLSGSMYFVPGDIDVRTEDTTFEFLSQKLLNVDEINQIIIHAQNDGSGSRYIILGDCCSDQAPSKWYKGITFNFLNAQEGTVTYDSAFLANRNALNSTLSASANATFDSFGNITVLPIDSTKPVVNEFNFISELIRSTTMNKNGNLAYYSSEMGTTTEMVASPYNNLDNAAVGPLCRRTLLFFKNGTLKLSDTGILNDYLSKLTDKTFDKKTSPALLDRSRNKE
jgi:hypothetical protein